jgi:hypothetical protein
MQMESVHFPATPTHLLRFLIAPRSLGNFASLPQTVRDTKKLSVGRAEPVYPIHDEEVGLIEGEESGSLLIRQCTSGRSLRSTFLSLRFVPRLDGMRVDDRPN